MKHRIKIKLKTRIFAVLILVNSLFLGLVLISLFNSINHKKQTVAINRNIELQNGINKLREYMLKDLVKADELVALNTEDDIDSKWKEHLSISEDLSSLVSNLTKIEAPETSDIIEVKNSYSNIILPSFKDIYKVKLRQTLGLLHKDSLANMSIVATNLSDLNTDFKSKIDALCNKLSRTNENLETKTAELLSQSLVRTNEEKYKVVILAIGILVFSILIFFIMIRVIFRSLNLMTEYISWLEKGNLSKNIEITTSDEIGEMNISLTNFVESLRKIAIALNEIGESNYTSDIRVLSDEDELGKAFLKMKANLQQANEKAVKMKEQEDLQNWATTGIARFGEILRRQTKDNSELSYNIIKALIEYVNANQGGVFIVQDEDSNNAPILELMATYAYGRKKFKEKTVRFGEGLVGTCAIEGQSIYLTNIPEGYIEIESYLGHASPKSLLLVPLKLEDKIFGVIEIASFYEFKPNEVKFIEDLAGTIASTIATSRINQRTAELLEKSKQQSEAMLAQEEEMRQNLEELQSTQEEAHRREKILNEELESAKIEIDRLRKDLSDLRSK